jgi:hypothetical protein
MIRRWKNGVRGYLRVDSICPCRCAFWRSATWCLCSSDKLSEADGIVFDAILKRNTRWRLSRSFTAPATRFPLHSPIEGAKLVRDGIVETPSTAAPCCPGQSFNEGLNSRLYVLGATVRSHDAIRCIFNAAFCTLYTCGRSHIARWKGNCPLAPFSDRQR